MAQTSSSADSVPTIMGNRAVVILLSAILVVLIVLVLVVLRTAGGPDADPAGRGVGPGEVVHREDLQHPPQQPELIGDPKRIREIAQEGKTYETLVKGGIDARVVDEDWGVKEVTNLAFMFESQVDRHIESNDGSRIVEVRDFKSVRAVKLLCESEIDIELGAPGVVVLALLDMKWPGTGTAVAMAIPVVEALAGAGATKLANDKSTKAFAQIDDLSEKKVRIVYVDGRGVQTVEPLGCELSPEQRDFIFHTAVLSDYYVLPEVHAEAGKSWSVDGRQLVGLLDPTMRGVPEGEIVVERGADEEERGALYAALRIKSGHVRIDSSDASRRRLGSFTPRGDLRYNLTDGYVESAELSGDLAIQEVSQDHLLFKSSFKTQPHLQVRYSCKLR